MLLAWVFWVIFSIVMHELAHGWMAIACGDRTPIEMGHMTWNPVTHMGWMSLILFAAVGIAWGAMPVTPSRLARKYDEALVAVAGPAMNVLLAVVCVAGQVAAADAAAQFFFSGAMLNVVLAVLNMIPIPPFDGGRIVATFAPGFRRLFSGESGAILGLILFVVIFFNASGVIFPMARRAVDTMTDALLAALAAAGVI